MGRGRPPERPQGPRLTVLFEDDALIALEKPADLPVGDRDAPGSNTLAAIAARMLPRAAPRGEAPLPAIAPPDGVSGVAVFAKNPAVRSKLWNAVRGHRADRLFLALVCGQPSGDQGTTLTRSSALRTNRRGVFESVPDGEPAPGPSLVTHVRTEHLGERYTLLRVRTEGDHPAQARVHLAEMGCPVAGDRAYNARENPLGRLGLHLAEVGFRHPQTGQTMRITSPPPASFFDAAGRTPPKSASVESNSQATDGGPRQTDAGWEHVAGWYEKLIGGGRADHQEDVIFPGVVRLLAPQPGDRVLDLACGAGHLGPVLADAGAGEVLGLDASPSLVEAARENAADHPRLRYAVGDARSFDLSLFDVPDGGPDGAPAGPVDGAVCVMAMMNLDPIEPVCASLAKALRVGGRAVIVLLHPAFRVPQQSGWLYRGDRGDGTLSRHIDRYLSEQAIQIVMNPGAVARGDPPVETTTHHRPIESYVNALAGAGLLVDAVEEWASQRTSKPGARANAENLARREIPLFMALRARRVSEGG